jgi:hypothetical protein
MKFERDDGNWYLSATNAEQGDLAVFVFAPEDAITTSKNGILTEMIVLIIAFALCIFALVLVFAAVQYRIKFNRHMRGNNGRITPINIPPCLRAVTMATKTPFCPPILKHREAINRKAMCITRRERRQ